MFPGSGLLFRAILLLLSGPWAPVRSDINWISTDRAESPPDRTRTDIALEPGGTFHSLGPHTRTYHPRGPTEPPTVWTGWKGTEITWGTEPRPNRVTNPTRNPTDRSKYIQPGPGTEPTEPPATEILQKSVTRRHVNRRTSPVDTTYVFATFTRTLLSVTDTKGSDNYTAIPSAYNTVTNPRSTGGDKSDTRTKNDEVTAQDSSTSVYGFPMQNSDSSTQGLVIKHQSHNTTWDSGNSGVLTTNTHINASVSSLLSEESSGYTDNLTRESEITIRAPGFTVWGGGNSSGTSTSTTNQTQSSGSTGWGINTTPHTGRPTSGSHRPLSPSIQTSTMLFPTTFHNSSVAPFISGAVTTVEVPSSNTSVLAPPSITTSNWSSSSSASSALSFDSSSTLPAPSTDHFSSPAGETITQSIPVSTRTHALATDGFSPSLLPLTSLFSNQPSSSPLPSLSETSVSLSVSTQHASLPVSPSLTPSRDIENTHISLESTSHSTEGPSPFSSPITGPISQTHQSSGTTTDGTEPLVALRNSSSAPLTDNLPVGTPMSTDGGGLTSKEKLQTASVTSPERLYEASAQTTVATLSITTASTTEFLQPFHHSTQELPQTSVTSTAPPELTYSTGEVTTNKTFTSWGDMVTSTEMTTKSRKTGIQTTTPQNETTVTSTTPIGSSTATPPSVKDVRCPSNPCQNGGQCVKGGDSYECQCLPAWQGVHCENDVDECLSDPCPARTSCVNKKGSYRCQCPPGTFLEKDTGCIMARTFLGHIKVPRSFLNGSLGRYSEVHQIEEELLQMLNKSFFGLSGYYQSDVTNSSDTNHIIISVQNVFSMSSNVTKIEIKQSLQNYMRSCESTPDISPGCHLILHPQLYYIADGLCSVNSPECDKDTAECSDVTGVAVCQCKPGYFKYTRMDQSCKACEDGFQRVNGTCVRCPFGLGGFNCSNPYQLITVIMAAAGGGLLLILGIALTVTCFRKNKNDLSKMIFKSGDFQMSPYAEYGKTQRSAEWGRETIEMQENGSTKNLLQMTDVYYSQPGLRNSELERNGLYPYTGLPGSRHSCIYPGQYNASFINEENRRRDYF